MDIMSDGTLVLVSQTSELNKTLELFDVADGSYQRGITLPEGDRIGEHGLVCLTR